MENDTLIRPLQGPSAEAFLPIGTLKAVALQDNTATLSPDMSLTCRSLGSDLNYDSSFLSVEPSNTARASASDELALHDRSTRTSNSASASPTWSPFKSPFRPDSSQKLKIGGKQLKLVTNMQQNGSKVVGLGSPTTNGVPMTTNGKINGEWTIVEDAEDQDIQHISSVSPTVPNSTGGRPVTTSTVDRTRLVNQNQVSIETTVIRDSGKDDKGKEARVSLEQQNAIKNSQFGNIGKEKETGSRETGVSGTEAPTLVPRDVLREFPINLSEIARGSRSPSAASEASMQTFRARNSIPTKRAFEDFMDLDDEVIEENGVNRFSTAAPATTKLRFEDIIDEEKQQQKKKQILTTGSVIFWPVSSRSSVPNGRTIYNGEAAMHKTAQAPDMLRERPATISGDGRDFLSMQSQLLGGNLDDLASGDSEVNNTRDDYIRLSSRQVESKSSLVPDTCGHASNMQPTRSARASEGATNRATIVNHVLIEQNKPQKPTCETAQLGEEFSDKQLQYLAHLGASCPDPELKRNIQAVVEVLKSGVRCSGSREVSATKGESPLSPVIHAATQSATTDITANTRLHLAVSSTGQDCLKQPASEASMKLPAFGSRDIGTESLLQEPEANVQSVFVNGLKDTPKDDILMKDLAWELQEHEGVEAQGVEAEYESLRGVSGHSSLTSLDDDNLIRGVEIESMLQPFADADCVGIVDGNGPSRIPKYEDRVEKNHRLAELGTPPLSRLPHIPNAENSKVVKEHDSPLGGSCPQSPGGRLPLHECGAHEVDSSAVVSDDIRTIPRQKVHSLEQQLSLKFDDPIQLADFCESPATEVTSDSYTQPQSPPPSPPVSRAHHLRTTHITQRDFATAASERTKRNTSSLFNTHFSGLQQMHDGNIHPRKRVKRNDSITTSAVSPTTTIFPRRATSTASSTDSAEGSRRPSPAAETVSGICHHKHVDPFRPFQDPLPICYDCAGMSSGQFGYLHTISPKYCIDNKVDKMPPDLVQEIVSRRLASVHWTIPQSAVRKYKIHNSFRVRHEYDDSDMEDYIDVWGPSQVKTNEEIFTRPDSEVDANGDVPMVGGSDTESYSTTASDASDDSDFTAVERWTGGNVKGPKFHKKSANHSAVQAPINRLNSQSLEPEKATTAATTENEMDAGTIQNMGFREGENGENIRSMSYQMAFDNSEQSPTVGIFFLPPPASIVAKDSAKYFWKNSSLVKTRAVKKTPRLAIRNQTPPVKSASLSPTQLLLSAPNSSQMFGCAKATSLGLVDTGGLETLDEGVASEDDSIPGTNAYAPRVAPFNKAKPGHERTIESRQSYKALAQRRTERGLPDDYGGLENTFIQNAADLRQEDRYNIRKGSQVPLYGGGGTTVVRGLGETLARANERSHVDSSVVGIVDVRRVNEPFTAALQEIARLIKDSGHPAGILPGAKNVLSGLQLDEVYFTGDQEKFTTKPIYGRPLDFSGPSLIKGVKLQDPITNHQYTISWTWAVLPVISVSKGLQNSDEVRGDGAMSITEKEVKAGFQVHLVVAKPGRAKDREDRKRLVFHERSCGWTTAQSSISFSKSLTKRKDIIPPASLKLATQTQPQAHGKAPAISPKLKSSVNILALPSAADPLAELAWKTNWEKFRWERWELEGLMRGLTRVWHAHGGSFPHYPDRIIVRADIHDCNFLCEWLEQVIIGRSEPREQAVAEAITSVAPTENARSVSVEDLSPLVLPSGTVTPLSTENSQSTEGEVEGVTSTPKMPTASLFHPHTHMSAGCVAINHRYHLACINNASKFKALTTPAGTPPPEEQYEALQASLMAGDISTLLRRSNYRKEVLKAELGIHPQLDSGSEIEVKADYIRNVLGYVDFEEEEKVYGEVKGGRRIDEVAKFDWKTAARVKGVAKELIEARDMLISADIWFWRKVGVQYSNE